jgi:hypothetical protein
MTLAIIGGMPEAAITAVWASSCAGEPVLIAGGPEHLLNKPLRVTTAAGTSAALLHAPPQDGALSADAYILIAPRAETHRLVFQHRHLLAGRPLLLAPGGVGLTEAVVERFEAWGLPAPALGQLPGFPAIGTVDGANVRIRAVKRRFPVGAFTAEAAERLSVMFRHWLPDLVPSSLALTSLSNTNNFIHPPLVLVNGARIEKGDKFLIFRDGLTPGSVRLIEAIDGERLAILGKLQLPKIALADWMRRYYEDQGMTGRDIDELLRTYPAFAGSLGPSRLAHRYLTEDVPSGLGPLEALGTEVGVPTPVLSSVITAVGCLLGEDLRQAAPADAKRLLRHSALDLDLDHAPSRRDSDRTDPRATANGSDGVTQSNQAASTPH